MRHRNLHIAASETTKTVVNLGALSLAFGRVNRITMHEDGETPESDTDHTVMLGLVACAFAAKHLPDLDLGLIAQYALVHDLVEVYAGDTPTLHSLSADAKADKAFREERAFERIRDEMQPLPWVASMIESYEDQQWPEAAYVKAMDKMLPKITHLLNDGATLHAEGMTHDALAARYAEQREELMEYATAFPPLFDLREELLGSILAMLREQEAERGPTTVEVLFPVIYYAFRMTHDQPCGDVLAWAGSGPVVRLDQRTYDAILSDAEHYGRVGSHIGKSAATTTAALRAAGRPSA